MVLPGELMKVFVIKEGKEAGQGVAYLDDGTMVVVDQARKALGKTIEVNVTSVLQTTAGKMIFCRWPDAGLVEDPASRNNRIGDRRDPRPARDLRAPERRENERRDGAMPIPPGVPVPGPCVARAGAGGRRRRPTSRPPRPRPRRNSPAMRLVAGLLLAAAVSAGAAEKPAPLQRRIDAILDRPAFAPAFWGVEVRNVRTGRILYARNAEKNFKPASSLKVVTTAAALDAFGPDARFRTTVETAGRLDAFGRIVGDVYLVGGGDPNLSGRFHDGRAIAPFEQLAAQMETAGVRRIEGRVLGHEGLFGGDRRGDDWAWGDLVWCYGAEVSALALNDNCVDLTVAPGEREGDAVVIGASPPSSYYRIVSTATTSARGAPGQLRLERDLGGNVIRISGTHAIGQKPWQGSVAIEDPARFAATVFREVLAAKGIVVTGEADTLSAPLPGTRRVLASLESAPVSELIATINKKSQNLHTEMLLRLLGARRSGVGTQESGAEAVEEFLHRMGVRTGGMAAPGRLRPLALRPPLAARDGHAAGGHGPASPRRRLPRQPARRRGGRHAGLEDEGHGGGGPRPGQDRHHPQRERPHRLCHRAQRRAPGLLRGGQPSHHRRLRSRGRPRRAGRAPRGLVSGPIAVAVAGDLAGRVRLGVVVIEGVSVRASDPALAAEIEADRAGSPRSATPGVPSGDVPGVEEARALYKAVGLDPTKTRPSNEALLRRVLKGEALYTVNTLVDALNLSSVREQMPFGLYDLDRVEPPVELRRGRPGRVVRRHPQGRGERGRAPGAVRRPRGLRQPDLRLRPHDDHPRHAAPRW